MSEVQEIVHGLENKHDDSYTPEQLRAWGHMIQPKKHDSYEVPPSKRFFKTKKADTTPPSVTLSPGKRISYRMECINGLTNGIVFSRKVSFQRLSLMNYRNDIK